MPPQINPDDASAQQDEVLLQRIAVTISRWHMEAPAIFLLEMCKPLSFIGSQFMLVMGPLLHVFIVEQTYDRLVEIFSRRENVEKLLCLIEEQAAGKDSR